MVKQCPSPAAHAATLRKAQSIGIGLNCPLCNMLVIPDSTDTVEQSAPRLVRLETSEPVVATEEDGDGNKSSISPVPFIPALDRYEGIQPGDLEFIGDDDGLEILEEVPERQAL